MNCCNCNIEMKKVKCMSDIKVQGGLKGLEYGVISNATTADLSLYICPQCGLSQFYIDDKNKLKELMDS